LIEVFQVNFDFDRLFISDLLVIFDNAILGVVDQDLQAFPVNSTI